MALVGPSPLGGSGLFAAASHLPGDKLLVEPHLLRLRSGTALARQEPRLLKASFEELAQDGGLELLRAQAFYRGPSDALGEQRRKAFQDWASSTWPEEPVEYQEAMAEAMTVMSCAPPAKYLHAFSIGTEIFSSLLGTALDLTYILQMYLI